MFKLKWERIIIRVFTCIIGIYKKRLKNILKNEKYLHSILEGSELTPPPH
jgi:hypothetical protein